MIVLCDASATEECIVDPVGEDAPGVQGGIQDFNLTRKRRLILRLVVGEF
jgi:hypothetical protein